eukprot:TRINITY_DN111422_c0_g1_i1.p1 TRINITY_DN111422_c0_g1~~TRINITY_DN111422_c0_g1_i1.p1  ORF type:complete len:872 (-),score=226.45 TRINITY_DN111422_c0_g1_i1:78-2693(-)
MVAPEEERPENQLPPIGLEVILHSLTKEKAAANGCHAHIARHCRDGRHMEVRLAQSDERLRVRLENTAITAASWSTAHEAMFTASCTAVATPGRGSKERTPPMSPSASEVATTPMPRQRSDAMLDQSLTFDKSELAMLTSNCVHDLRKTVAKMQTAWRSSRGARDQLRDMLNKQPEGASQRSCLEELERGEVALLSLELWAQGLDWRSLCRAAGGGEDDGHGTLSKRASTGGSASKSKGGTGPGLRRASSCTRLREALAHSRNDVVTTTDSCPASPCSAQTEQEEGGVIQQAAAQVVASAALHAIETQLRSSSDGVLKDVCTVAASTSALGLDVRHRSETSMPELVSGLAKFENLRTLKLDLSHHAQLTSAREVGLSLKPLRKLQELVLKLCNCPCLESLSGLGEAFGSLSTLETLTVDLRQCAKLAKLEQLGEHVAHLAGSLTGLTLRLGHCEGSLNMEEFARSMAKLTKLKSLHLDLSHSSIDSEGVALLAAALFALRGLTSLQLDLSYNDKVLEVDEIGHAVQASESVQSLLLDLRGCSALASVDAFREASLRPAGFRVFSLDLRECDALPLELQRKFSGAADFEFTRQEVAPSAHLARQVSQEVAVAADDEDTQEDLAANASAIAATAAAIAAEVAATTRASIMTELTSRPEETSKTEREKIQVLQESTDGEEPTDAEVEEYAVWLGMSLPEDNDLLWVARAGLKEPLPKAWKACQMNGEDIFYFNFETGESIWDHPCDEHYKRILKEHMEKKRANAVPSSSAAAAVEDAAEDQPPVRAASASTAYGTSPKNSPRSHASTLAYSASDAEAAQPRASGEAAVDVASAASAAAAAVAAAAAAAAPQAPGGQQQRRPQSAFRFRVAFPKR